MVKIIKKGDTKVTCPNCGCVFEYTIDDIDIGREYNHCMKESKSFIKISQDKIICKKINADEFNKELSDSYLKVANDYKKEGEIWGEFIK